MSIILYNAAKSTEVTNLSCLWNVCATELWTFDFSGIQKKLSENETHSKNDAPHSNGWPPPLWWVPVPVVWGSLGIIED